MTTRLRLFLIVVAGVVALNVWIGTSLIDSARYMYSPSLQYRKQTDALLAGRFALSDNPAATEFDMAWANGGVQQVWGLGVPLWRLPFEAVAKICGLRAFPDRIALLLAITIAAYIVLRAFTAPEPVQDLGDWLRGIRDNPFGITSAIILIAFPPVITLCRGAFNVYEEAVVYEYYFCIGLLAATIDFARRPRLSVFLPAAWLAGCAGFVRPTAIVYGVASLTIMCVYARSAGWKWGRCALGPVLFAATMGLLLASNFVRFGSPLEFGHRLNLSGYEMTYISRFSTPFDQESWFNAVKEVVGATFFVKTLNGYNDCYGDGLVAWQAPTIRWRAFYSTTFDVFEFAALIVFWAWSFSRLVAHWRRPARMSPFVALAASSFISFLPLVAFYARYCALSSRYMLDFAPAVAATTVGCLGILNHTFQRSRFPIVIRACLTLIVIAWWIAEIALARNLTGPTVCWSQAQVLAAMQESRSTKPSTIPDHYEIKDLPLTDHGNFRNGSGWSQPNGTAGPLVILFVEDPERLSLELVPKDSTQITERDYQCIQAKIGLEFLKLESASDTDRGRILTFAGPKEERYRRGVQVAFLTFLPPSKFRESNTSPFNLIRIDWKAPTGATIS